MLVGHGVFPSGDRLSPELWQYIAVLTFGLAFLAALAAYSLRNYLRSRLAQLCRHHDNENRFGAVLKNDVQALQACELVQLISLLVLGVAFAGGLLPQQSSAGTVASVLTAFVLTGVVVLIALPSALSRVLGESLLYHAWPVLAVATRMLQPLLSLSRWIDTFCHRLAGRQDPDTEDSASITDELQSVLDEGEREGQLESRAGRMIERIMELQEEDVSAVMTPRTEMVCIQRDVPIDEARKALLDAGHSRVPVVGESADDVIGILYAKDLLQHLATGNNSDVSLAEIAREPFYIPETTAVDHLLERMKRERFHLAIVLDEYGGVAGLITMEDILEEIVGEIADEHDPTEAVSVRRIDALTAEVDARVHLDDLNEEFGLELPEDNDFDTIGGFVFSELGHIPKPGETLTWQQLRLTVLDADKRKINQLRLEIDPTLTPSVDEA